MLTISKIPATVYLDSANFVLAFLNKKEVANTPPTHITKAEAMGKAALWHGYAALEGLGTTRIKNQINALKPTIYTDHLLIICLIFWGASFLIIALVVRIRVYLLFLSEPGKLPGSLGNESLSCLHKKDDPFHVVNIASGHTIHLLKSADSLLKLIKVISWIL